jgi:hypothetical protein
VSEEAAVRAVFEVGVARFDAGRFHEAQQAWEPLWHGAQGDRRDALLALVRIAAALDLYERGSAFGFADLLRVGAAGLDPRFCAAAPSGLDAEAVRRTLAPWVAHAARVLAGADLRAGAPAAYPALGPAAGRASPDPVSGRAPPSSPRAT